MQKFTVIFVTIKTPELVRFFVYYLRQFLCDKMPIEIGDKNWKRIEKGSEKDRKGSDCIGS